jgi:hypothetical protein
MPRPNSNNKTPAWLAQAQIDIENHPNQEIHLAMQLPEALALIGLLQLATRHAHLPERQIQVAHNIVDALAEGIATTPALNKLIAAGWQPQYDYNPADQQ